MKILLSYSKLHFDPGLKPKDHKYWGSSANILARQLYETLSEFGEVTYIDAYSHEPSDLADKYYDVFIGIQQRFAEFSEASGAKQKLFFAVNMHPAARNQLLRDFVRENNLPPAALREWDIVDESQAESAIRMADTILCVGNIAVYNSYITNGVPKNKIKMLNYDVGNPVVRKRDHRLDSPPSFVYVASDVGLRKGLHIVNDLFSQLCDQDIDYSLQIIGKIDDKHSRDIVSQLVKSSGGKVHSLGWVDASSKDYANLMEHADFVIAPSIEEGQAGAVLDAMRFGAIPLITKNTGVDFSPLGELELVIGSQTNWSIMKKALSLNAEQRHLLSGKTIEYYKEFHTHFPEILRQTLEDFFGGSIYPLVSVVLPIFNKESTIIPLLQNLDAALVTYGNSELHVIFDGCKDQTEELVRRFYRPDRGYRVTFEVTPNVFEVITNNLGLKKSQGRYSIIVQDDNFVYDRNFIFEAVNFLDKDPQAAILGCLAGVNFYPRGTAVIGKGQVAETPNETYWRQDAQTDPAYNDQIFQVDACMRGPLIFRKSYLESHGYLDEAYAPFYMDDMDIAFRAGRDGYKVYCMLSDVENLSLTVATYDKKRNEFWERTMKTNSDEFYKRWHPTIEKDHLRLIRTKITDARYSPKRFKPGVTLTSRLTKKLTRLARLRHIFNDEYCRAISDSLWKSRMAWVEHQAALVPKGASVLDIGAGQTPYRAAFAHTKYVTQDLAQTPDFEYGKIDIISDITNIPLPDASQDYILCTEVFEHIPEPLKALKEIRRLLKPGGKLIFSAPLGSGQHQAPYHFYGGYTRYWYQKFFPAADLAILSLVPNGGLNAHTIEMLWRSQPQVVGRSGGMNPLSRLARKFVQIAMYNYPTIKLELAERDMVNEDFTACFFCVAEKRSDK